MQKHITSPLRISLFFAIIISISWLPAHAQIRIGTSATPINPGASLEVVGQPSGNTIYQGLLLPRVALVNFNTWTLSGTPVDGMLVFNTTTTTGDYAVSPGVYCWYNFHWNRQSPAIDPAIISSIDCQQSTSASGMYYPAVALTSANTKQVSITPSSAGPYSATTNLVNGYSFSASGTFTPAQVGIPQLITLFGTGTPQAASVNTFTLTAGIQSCVFTITVLGGVDCSGPLAGTYQANLPLTSANTKQITYVPASAGPFSATTSTVNGYSFSASGTFTAQQVGVPQTITLQGSGTPQAKIIGSRYITSPDTFTLTIGNQTCNFDVNALPPYDCNGPLTGTYKVNVPLDNTNTKQITYVPNAVGSHYIGFRFFQNSPNGNLGAFALQTNVTFTNEQIGVPQTLTLTGVGTPIVAQTVTGTLQIMTPGNSDYKVGCSLDITVIP